VSVADGAELLAIADRIVAQAKAGEQIEAFVARATDTAVRIYESDIEQLQSAQSQGVGIRVISDHRTGFAYTGSLDERSIAETLADARDNVAFGEADEFAGLASPDGVAVPKLDQKVALAKELELRTLAGDARIVVESSEYADAFGEGAVATSTGIRSWGRENGCYVSVSTMAVDGDETQTGFGFEVGRDPYALDMQRAADMGVERAVRLLGAVKPASGRMTVVLDPWVTAQFLSVLSATVNGEAVLKGRSLFAGRLGEQVASPLVTFVDDPTNPLAYTATEVDGEGLAARRNVLIDKGVLRQFVHSSYSGRRASLTSTGNAVRGGFKSSPGVGCIALSLLPGTMTADEIIRDVGDGLLVQQVAGIHSGVNPISGDFSTGASGVMIRNGEIAEPVRELTIASTLQRMLHDIRAVGGDLTWLPMRAAGVSLVISDVTVSGA
jgi:PmbA protein